MSPGHWVIGNDETGLILGPADDRQDALEQANRFRLLLREIDVKTLKEIQVRNDPKQAEVEGIQF